MKRTPDFLVVLVLIFLASCSSAGSPTFSGGTSEALQHDLDIVRLKDIATLSGYIEKYRNATGKYPFEGEADVPHYVHIAAAHQRQYAKGGPPYEHKKTDVGKFIVELQSILGSDIQIPFDLQQVPVNKPNFYVYMVVDSTYYLAVHLHHEFSFSNPVSNHYQKLEVTNSTRTKRKGTWQRDKLLINSDYIAAVYAEPYKPGYAERLREKLGGNSAFDG